MVISHPDRNPRTQGTRVAGRLRAFATIEMVVTLAVLVLAVLPLAASFIYDAKLLRVSYQKSVVMELVDGEMEILAAGEWRAYPPGVHEYPLRGLAATNLPPGHCQLTVDTRLLRLEWKSEAHTGVGTVVREVRR
jgi:hypothetical protein